MGENDGETLKLLGRREEGELYEKRRKEESEKSNVIKRTNQKKKKSIKLPRP